MTVLRTRELVEVQNRVDSLRNELMTIDENWQAIHNADARLEEQYRIAVEIALNRLSEMIMQLSGNVAESQTKIFEINRQAGLISSQFAERARQDSLVETVKEQERLALFDLAKSNYERGNFSLAIDDFSEYIEKHPDSEESALALYWMAEAHYALDSLETAKQLFQRYYSENREGKLACSALYKLGLIFNRQGQNRNRDSMWNQLDRQCPDSEEARLARENRRN
jgi:TolA-binding protein